MANVTSEEMAAWCRKLLCVEQYATEPTLSSDLAVIPRLESLSHLKPGTAVLVRGDVDAKPGPSVGEGDIRLRSMVDTLRFGQKHGWKQVIFGHIGRKPEGSLSAVGARLQELLGSDVTLIKDWLDESGPTIRDEVGKAIAAAAPGSFFLLDNTRRYEIERVLWKAQLSDVPQLAPGLARLANEFAEKVAKIYVNEALSAGSLDASSTVVPAAMEQVALGKYLAQEFEGPMESCLNADLVVFSGLKADKLDDLSAMIQKGRLRMILSAGSLAMALKKASGRLSGKDVCVGAAENPGHKDKPYYIPAERIDQAFAMLEAGRQRGIDFVLPVDFVLSDGRVVEELGPDDQQLDVGPKTNQLFHDKIGVFLEEMHVARDRQTHRPVAFYNGVFGMFEDPRFAEGTRRFIPELKRMKDSGVGVYVGGGEGGTALEKYGEPNWVTHVFTAGGTVLNVLGHQPVPYLMALRMAAERQK